MENTFSCLRLYFKRSISSGICSPDCVNMHEVTGHMQLTMYYDLYQFGSTPLQHPRHKQERKAPSTSINIAHTKVQFVCFAHIIYVSPPHWLVYFLCFAFHEIRVQITILCWTKIDFTHPKLTFLHNYSWFFQISVEKWWTSIYKTIVNT